MSEGRGSRGHDPADNDRATVLGVDSKVRADSTRGGSWTVKRLADAAGVRPDTVRYYEKAGLLPPPPRTTAGYRAYEPGMVDRLRFIQGAQRLGLSLAEIRDLLAVRDNGACPCEPAAPLLRRHIAELDAEMARLGALRAELVTMADALPGNQCPRLVRRRSWGLGWRGAAATAPALSRTPRGRGRHGMASPARCWSCSGWSWAWCCW
jgi:DNA-binding transcriptional MerR regulator